jgi:hypothetical protein
MGELNKETDALANEKKVNLLKRCSQDKLGFDEIIEITSHQEIRERFEAILKRIPENVESGLIQVFGIVRGPKVYHDEEPDAANQISLETDKPQEETPDD